MGVCASRACLCLRCSFHTQLPSTQLSAKGSVHTPEHNLPSAGTPADRNTRPLPSPCFPRRSGFCQQLVPAFEAVGRKLQVRAPV